MNLFLSGKAYKLLQIRVGPNENHLSSSIHVISHAQTCLSWSHSQDNVLIYAKKMFSEFGQTLTELEQRSAVWTWGTWTENSWKMGGGGKKKKKGKTWMKLCS